MVNDEAKRNLPEEKKEAATHFPKIHNEEKNSDAENEPTKETEKIVDDVLMEQPLEKLCRQLDELKS